MSNRKFTREKCSITLGVSHYGCTFHLKSNKLVSAHGGRKKQSSLRYGGKV